MSNNDKLMGSIEAKLFQIESMAKIALNNHNYKLAGYGEPFINNTDMANLMWAITDLANDAYTKLQALGLSEGANNA